MKVPKSQLPLSVWRLIRQKGTLYWNKMTHMIAAECEGFVCVALLIKTLAPSLKLTWREITPTPLQTESDPTSNTGAEHDPLKYFSDNILSAKDEWQYFKDIHCYRWKISDIVPVHGPQSHLRVDLLFYSLPVKQKFRFLNRQQMRVL